MQCTCHGCPAWHLGWQLGNASQKNTAWVGKCDLEHMLKHLGADNDFKHCVLNHMDMKLATENAVKHLVLNHMDMNMKQTMWLQKLLAVIFPSKLDIVASQHLAFWCWFMAIWWHCVSLPLPGFLG